MTKQTDEEERRPAPNQFATRKLEADLSRRTIREAPGGQYWMEVTPFVREEERQYVRAWEVRVPG